ncbi:MAG: RNA-binding domain-containing protein [Nanoarchaeota archaeon]
MDNQYLKNIKTGMKVVILTSQNKNSTGFVEEIATRNPFNEEGIMVRLKSGDVGRVKKIILSEPEQNEKAMIEIKKILEKGENFYTEFKAEALWSTTYNPVQMKESKSLELREYGQKASKVIIAKSIAAFLNSEGGNLIIGVKEKKDEGKFEIVGIAEDLKKVRDSGIDGFKRIIIDEIIRTFFPPKIFNHLNDYISFEFVIIDGKTICWIKIKKSDSRVFLKINDKEIFMIRVDSENRTLEGEKLVDYCVRKWGGR